MNKNGIEHNRRCIIMAYETTDRMVTTGVANADQMKDSDS